MTVHIRAEADEKLGPGHAVILVEGAGVAPDDIRFTVRRPGYREDSLGPSGWQAAEAVLVPDAAYVAGGTLFLHVGPGIVSHMEPGMNVAFSLMLPDGATIDGRLAWPAIAGPIGGAGARRGRMVATRRAVGQGPALRSGGALVGDIGETSARAAATPAAMAPSPDTAQPAVPEAPPEPVDAAPEPEQAADAVEDGDETEPEEGRVAALGELRATRDASAPVAVRRGPWRRRVAAVASIAILLVAGGAVASFYLGREQVCASESFGPTVDGWGLCPPVVVAAAPEPEPEAPEPAGEADAVAPDGRGWNFDFDPLAWLGPNRGEGAVDRGAPEGAAAEEPAEAADSQEPDAPAPVPDTPATQRALALEYLSSEPSPEAAFARADELFSEGQVDAAFLIYRYAAEGGHDEAAAEVAAMYDPETYTSETSPLPRPNPVEARRWYQRAVDAGNVASLLPLARLLAADNALEDAREVLRLAEQAGLGDAARLLEELQ